MSNGMIYLFHEMATAIIRPIKLRQLHQGQGGARSAFTARAFFTIAKNPLQSSPRA
jgi:hypothetical protein